MLASAPLSQLAPNDNCTPVLTSAPLSQHAPKPTLSNQHLVPRMLLVQFVNDPVRKADFGNIDILTTHRLEKMMTDFTGRPNDLGAIGT
jgi:hypothetical protein